MNWSINGKTVKSLMKDGKEIVKVERVEDGKILYEKESNNNYVVATVTGNRITLGQGNYQWLESVGNVVIDWGDGTSDIVNNPTTPLSHTCNDGLSNHDITFIGEVTSLGIGCFMHCTGLTSVTIPNSVTSLGNYCFMSCNSLIDYQLYWTGNNIITYDSNKMPNNTNTVFTIPNGETANYVAKGYPSSKLTERS